MSALTRRIVLAAIIFLVFLMIPKRISGSTIRPVRSTQVHIVQEDSLQLWIDKLAKAERCPAKGIIDSNHKMSYGCLCFQKETFIRQTRLYLMPHATNEEILSKIGNCQFQKKLAYEMIKARPSNTKHWYLSVKKIGNYKASKKN